MQYPLLTIICIFYICLHIDITYSQHAKKQTHAVGEESEEVCHESFQSYQWHGPQVGKEDTFQHAQAYVEQDSS